MAERKQSSLKLNKISKLTSRFISGGKMGKLTLGMKAGQQTRSVSITGRLLMANVRVINFFFVPEAP